MIRHAEELVEDDVFCITDQSPDQKVIPRDTIFTDFVKESTIPTVANFPQKESFQNNNPVKSDDSIQSASQNELEQGLEKQININNNKHSDSLSLVSMTKSNSPNEKDRNMTEKQLQTYVRKNYQAKESVPPSLHNQDSKPRT